MTRSRIQCNICSGDRLSGYLDGTLNVDLMRRIGAHLKECQECFHEYEKLEQTKRMLASLKDQTPQLTPEFMSAALRAVRQSRLPEDRGQRQSRLFVRPRLIGGTVACAALLGIFLFSVIPTSQIKPAPQSNFPLEQIDINSMISAHANFLAGKHMSDPSNNRIIRSDLALQTSGISQPADLREASLGLADDANMD